MTLLRTRTRRAGFTLIELLVVIGIIVLLVGITIPAVMKVLEAGPRADTSARLNTLGAAVSTFNNDGQFGQVKYIPAGQVDQNPSSPTFGQVVGPFRLRNSYTSATVPDMYSFEAQYIARVFGSRVNLADLGYPNLAGDLDGNQCLVFFLGGIPEPDGQGNVAFTGFSKDPQKPFTRAVQGEDRKKSSVELNRKRYMLGPNGFAWATDAYGRPFAYFSAFNGKAGKMSGHNPFGGGVRPYTNGGKFENESSFQLISAGRDGVFGTSGNWANVDPPGQDDMANFSTRMLGAGPQ